MRAIDTNVLVRLITRDHAEQTRAAEAAVANGAWVSHVVLAEATGVLGSLYGLSRPRLAETLRMILDSSHLAVQDADMVAAALTEYEQNKSVSFADCLILHVSKQVGHTPLCTFDRDLAKLEGVERVSGR